MQNRWFVLALLFLARLSMGVQFQGVPALAPLYIERFGIDLAGLGFLIALYLVPGAALAWPGGAVAARFGDRQVVLVGMALMLAGGLMMALGPGWWWQLGGRLMAGTGAVFLNVLMSKMVADAFAGREIASAMGIFVSSWPIGLAIGLLILPPVGAAGGLSAGLWLSAGVVAIALGLFLAFYRAPRAVPGAAPVVRVPLRGRALVAVCLAGAIWGLFNAAFGTVFSFGPTMLTERGFGATAAASVTSLTFWAAAISTPMGGILADRSGRRDTVLVISTIGFGLCLSLAAELRDPWLAFLGAGFLSCLAAGPIMSLPSDVLQPGNRATGMGVFFTVYYIGIALGPVIAGALADLAGSARIAFHFGTGLLVLVLLALAGFRTMARGLRATV